MANEFMDFASGMSSLGHVRFCEVIKIFWTRLKDDYEEALKSVSDDPTNEQKNQFAKQKIDEFIVFAELMNIGNGLTDTAIDSMRRDALISPDAPGSKRIIELSDEINGINSLKVSDEC